MGLLEEKQDNILISIVLFPCWEWAWECTQDCIVNHLNSARIVQQESSVVYLKCFLPSSINLQTRNAAHRTIYLFLFAFYVNYYSICSFVSAIESLYSKVPLHSIDSES